MEEKMSKICPLGQDWAKIHRTLLKYSSENTCNPPEPPRPLILAGWAFSSDQDKSERWQATVAWARSNGCGNLVEGLRDEQFYWIRA